MFNVFDAGVILFLNDFARQSVWLDAFAHGFTNNYLLKSASLIALIYWAWFQRYPDAIQQRAAKARLLIALLAAFAAPACARIFELLLPFRPRPLHEPLLHFIEPLFMREDVDRDWSSFPSDTMALIVPLVIGLFLVSRRIGWLALVIAVLAALARMYSGLHYPTDIMGGAALGVIAFVVLDRPWLKQKLTAPCFWLLEKYPQIFYVGFFLFTYQIANVFEQAFNIIKNVFRHG
ncbi:MAG: phosphatase PAP2 family protein [Alphaproteobacteria bacterium]|nr:phosphatase PAP2 family protein [Alphaproteobacteria bacterium]